MTQLKTPLRAKLHERLTWKFGQRLSMACGVDFVLFKPLYVKIAFIATFLIFHHMNHSKLSAKTASEDCILFFLKSQFLSMTKCWVYLFPTATSTLCKVRVSHSRKSLKSLFYWISLAGVTKRGTLH